MVQIIFFHQGLEDLTSLKRLKMLLTVSEQQAAEGGDGDEDRADGVEAQSEPAGGGEEQEPGLCMGQRDTSLTLKRDTKDTEWW